jgi:hypothetical protein
MLNWWKESISDEGFRPWSFESVVDWFETEGATFLTSKGRYPQSRVVVTSQGENEVVQSVWEYLRSVGFHPTFRPTCKVLRKGQERKRSAECELRRNLEQECFLRQALPLLRTERRRREVLFLLTWLKERRKSREHLFKPFRCPSLGPKVGARGFEPPSSSV